MRLAALWLLLLVVAGAVAMSSASCSLNHRSDAFACTSTAQCDDNRECVEGFCVVPGGPDARVPDARPGDPDADPVPDGRLPDAPIPDLCPDICTSCVSGGTTDVKTCIIDCAEANDERCVGLVKCPAGFDCAVNCSTQNSCRNGVNCFDAESCDIQCTGDGSCRNLLCGEGPCNINCQGDGSCRGVSCINSCACDVDCSFSSDCSMNRCPSLECETFDGGCSSLIPGCNQCM